MKRTRIGPLSLCAASLAACVSTAHAAPLSLGPPLRMPYALKVVTTGAVSVGCRVVGATFAESQSRVSGRVTTLGASPVRHECQACDGLGACSGWIAEANVTCYAQAGGTGCPASMFAKAPDPPVTVPAAPGSIAFASTASGMRASWTDRSWNEDYFRVEISRYTSAGPWMDVQHVTANTTSTYINCEKPWNAATGCSHDDGGLLGLTVYFVHVAAVNAAGDSVDPPVAPPLAPTLDARLTP